MNLFVSVVSMALRILIVGGASPSVVQKQIRHSNARITLGIYGHVVGDAQRCAVESHAGRIEAGGQ